MLGLNILGIQICYACILPEQLQIMLQSVNVASDSFPKNPLPVHIDVIGHFGHEQFLFSFILFSDSIGILFCFVFIFLFC